MDKTVRQTLAANIQTRIDGHKTITSQNDLAKRSGVAQSYLSRVMRKESAITVDRLAKIAKAFGCETWELLVDSEKIRRMAIERVLSGPAVPDDRVEQALGSAKKRIPATEGRKK